jgi:hypothetical protein
VLGVADHHLASPSLWRRQPAPCAWNRLSGRAAGRRQDHRSRNGKTPDFPTLAIPGPICSIPSPRTNVPIGSL